MKKYFFIGVFTITIVSALSISAFILYSFKTEQDRIFTLETQVLENTISKKINLIEAVLKNYQTFFHSIDEIDPDMFRIFSKEMLSLYPYMNRFYYSPVVLDTQKESFEKEKRSQGYYKFSIKNDGNNGIEYTKYFPVLYIEPFTPVNSKYLGVDIYNHDVNKKPLTQSIESGNITLSVKSDNSIMFFVPVYNSKSIPITKDDRKQRINGIITLKVFLKDIIPDINTLDNTNSSLTLENKENIEVVFSHISVSEHSLFKIFKLNRTHQMFLDKMEMKLNFNRTFYINDISINVIFIGIFVFLLIVTGNYYLLKKHFELKDELQKSIRQEEMLIQQSKLASMGEMIGNIAHQWRQPLSQIAAIHMNMKVTYDFDKFTKEYLQEKLKEAKTLTTYMSETISDFQNFFKPAGEKEDFSVEQACEKSFHILESALYNHGIKIKFNIKNDVIVNGYKNEYSQVILNILSNAKDVILERKVKHPMISIEISKNENNYAMVKIEDNAGGIPDDIINKIFEPYFTTREKSQGTGIGLYMSKNIIERNMKGFIKVENTGNGALFTIEVPESI